MSSAPVSTIGSVVLLFFSPPAASSSKNKLSLLLYLTYLNVQQPGETIFKPFPSKVLFQLNSAADRTSGSTFVGELFI